MIAQLMNLITGWAFRDANIHGNAQVLATAQDQTATELVGARVTASVQKWAHLTTTIKPGK